MRCVGELIIFFFYTHLMQFRPFGKYFVLNIIQCVSKQMSVNIRQWFSGVVTWQIDISNWCESYIHACRILGWHTGPRFNIKMSSYQYRKSYCGDKTVVRSSYLHNGVSYTGKMTSLYWIRALVPVELFIRVPVWTDWHIVYDRGIVIFDRNKHIQDQVYMKWNKPMVVVLFAYVKLFR